MNRMKQAKNSGFTLIELLIAIAIVGILAAVAYPSYQESVRKGKRTDAAAALQDAAQQLERCFTRFNSYLAADGCNVAFPIDSPEGEYQITASTRTVNNFTLTATPKAGSSQASDTKCVNYTLTHTNAKGATGTKGVDYCW